MLRARERSCCLNTWAVRFISGPLHIVFTVLPTRLAGRLGSKNQFVCAKRISFQNESKTNATRGWSGVIDNEL